MNKDQTTANLEDVIDTDYNYEADAVKEILDPLNRQLEAVLDHPLGKRVFELLSKVYEDSTAIRTATINALESTDSPAIAMKLLDYQMQRETQAHEHFVIATKLYTQAISAVFTVAKPTIRDIIRILFKKFKVGF